MQFHVHIDGGHGDGGEGCLANALADGGSFFRSRRVGSDSTSCFTTVTRLVCVSGCAAASASLRARGHAVVVAVMVVSNQTVMQHKRALVGKATHAIVATHHASDSQARDCFCAEQFIKKANGSNKTAAEGERVV